MDRTYSYDSATDYAEAYGFASAAEMAEARRLYDSTGTGHHPELCGLGCPCKGV
jgi:hypothetical protein